MVVTSIQEEDGLFYFEAMADNLGDKFAGISAKLVGVIPIAEFEEDKITVMSSSEVYLAEAKVDLVTFLRESERVIA